MAQQFAKIEEVSICKPGAWRLLTAKAVDYPSKLQQFCGNSPLCPARTFSRFLPMSLDLVKVEDSALGVRFVLCNKTPALGEEVTKTAPTRRDDGLGTDRSA
jgi:hypothetical protein